MTIRATWFFGLVLLALVSVGCGAGGSVASGDEDTSGLKDFTVWDSGELVTDFMGGDSKGDDKGPDAALDVDSLSPEIKWDNTFQELLDIVDEGGFLWPCENNNDCDSKFCVPFLDDTVCTVVCQEECPDDWECKPAPGATDPVFICLPIVTQPCKVCQSASECTGKGDACLSIGTDAGAGKWCFGDCSKGQTCPPDYTCSDVTDEAGTALGKFCIPEAGSCICLGDTNGTSRPCEVENEHGKCLGTETCQGELGWAGCTAKTPKAEECDGADNNCDGATDEGFSFVDWDGAQKQKDDPCGTGACGGGTVVCSSLTELRCSTAGNAKAETCNGEDDDCDGTVDNGVKTRFYKDADNDGHGWAEDFQEACTAPVGYVALDDDCDDQNDNIYPTNLEQCDGYDNNCDGEVDEGFFWTHPHAGQVALDSPCSVGICGEGTVVCTPEGDAATCNALSKATAEVCDDQDQDCDGVADNGCDDDLDGYCDAAITPPGNLPAICPKGSGDCNDSVAAVNPGMVEVCNLVDDNCSGTVDDNVIDCDPPKCDGSGNSYAVTPQEVCVTGVCTPPSAQACGLYTCDLGGNQGDQCATSCIADDYCVDAAHCDEGTNKCVSDFNNGTACVEDSDCQSSHCQNGYCCAFGDCCASASNCSLGAYSEPAVCNTPENCQGTRRDPACVNSECRKSDPIADDSACTSSVLSDECGAFIAVYCNGQADQSDPACASSCSSDAQCDPSAHCENGSCVADKPLGGNCSAASWCASGHCVDGVCCDNACTGTCKSCDLAGSVGTCKLVPSGQDPDSECAGFSCSSYYWGWSGSTCYKRSDVTSAGATCNGSGACIAASTACPLQGQGSAASSCNETCQTPNLSTCTGGTAGQCTNVNIGTHSCGVGECARTVDKCVNGSPNPCYAGSPTSEICDNKDQDCNGVVDDNVSGAKDIYEPNEYCSSPFDSGELAQDNTETLIATATIYPSGDWDYYKLLAKESPAICFPGWPEDLSLTVRLVPPQGADCVNYNLYLYDESCSLLKSSTVSSCSTDTLTYEWSGNCTINNDKLFIINVRPVSSSWECKSYNLYADVN